MLSDASVTSGVLARSVSAKSAGGVMPVSITVSRVGLRTNRCSTSSRRDLDNADPSIIRALDGAARKAEAQAPANDGKDSDQAKDKDQRQKEAEV